MAPEPASAGIEEIPFPWRPTGSDPADARATIRALRLVDIDMFDLGWPVRHPHWFSDDQPCDLIVRCLALKNVFGFECIRCQFFATHLIYRASLA